MQPVCAPLAACVDILPADREARRRARPRARSASPAGTRRHRPPQRFGGDRRSPSTSPRSADVPVHLPIARNQLAVCVIRRSPSSDQALACRRAAPPLKRRDPFIKARAHPSCSLPSAACPSRRSARRSWSLFLLAIFASFAHGRHQRLRRQPRRRAAARWSRSATNRSPSAISRPRWSGCSPRPASRIPKPTYATIAGDAPSPARPADRRSRAARRSRATTACSCRAAGRCRDRQPAADPRARRQVQRSRPMPSSSQQRLTDAQRAPPARAATSPPRLLLGPVAANARVPVGVATPICLDAARSARRRVVMVPTRAFRAGLTPTDGRPPDLLQPEPRSATWCPSSACCASPRSAPNRSPSVVPTEPEIAAYYKANQATYGGQRDPRASARRWSRPSRPPTPSPRARAAGASFVAAAAPAGLSAEDVSVGPQTRAAIRRRSPGDAVAAAAFAAAHGRDRRADPVGPRLARHQDRRVRGEAGTHARRRRAAKSSPS